MYQRVGKVVIKCTEMAFSEALEGLMQAHIATDISTGTAIGTPTSATARD